jgi:cell division protein FtsX
VAPSDIPNGRRYIEVFMIVRASDAEIDGVRQVLLASTDVAEFAFLTKRDALREFRRRFRTDRDLTENVTAADLPTSFRFVLVDGADADAVVDGLATLPGIENVADLTEPPPCENIPVLRTSTIDLDVFMEVDANDDRIAIARRYLQRHPQVQGLVYSDKEDAFREFRQIFADDPEIIASTTADQLPVSFRVDLIDADRSAKVARQIEDHLNGVDEIAQRLRNLRDLTEACRAWAQTHNAS